MNDGILARVGGKERFHLPYFPSCLLYTCIWYEILHRRKHSVLFFFSNLDKYEIASRLGRFVDLLVSSSFSISQRDRLGIPSLEGKTSLTRY